jgi:hypothetical protein
MLIDFSPWKSASNGSSSTSPRGGLDPDALITLAGQLVRLQREFSPAQLAELNALGGGRSFPNLAHALLNACDPDTQIEQA